MKKVLILALCMLCILSGCKNGKVNNEQQKVYYGFKDALMNNGDLISSNIPFEYEILIEETKGKYLYTVIVKNPQVAMNNIQMMILNPEDATKDIETATLGIYDETNYHMIPNQSNEKTGYYKELQLKGSSEHKDFKIYVTLAWKDSNQLIQYQVFFSFNVVDRKC